MKHDLDLLMGRRGLDAFVMARGEEYSINRDYLSNGTHISGFYALAGSMHTYPS